MQLFWVLLTLLSGFRFGGNGRRFRFLGLPDVAYHEYLCPVAGGFQSRTG